MAGLDDDPGSVRPAAAQWASAASRPPLRLWHSFSAVGLLLGTLFFAFSLTPSLLPRGFLIQGVLSGASAAAGYGLGVLLAWLWAYLRLPPLPWRRLRVVKLVEAIACAGIAALFLWRAAGWRDSIRLLMGIEPTASIDPWLTGIVAALSFVALIGLARLFRWTCRWLSARATRWLPPRTARVIGIVLAVVIFWGVTSGILLRGAIHVARFVVPPVRCPDPARVSPPGLRRYGPAARPR